MINIDEACKDGIPKHYGAVLSDNAAIPLLLGPRDVFEGYNLYRSDEYIKMIADLYIHNGQNLYKQLDSRLGTHEFDLKNEFTTASLQGWHLIRTRIPLSGEKLRQRLVKVQEIMESPFYSKSMEEQGIIHDSLEIEDVYAVKNPFFVAGSSLDKDTIKF